MEQEFLRLSESELLTGPSGLVIRVATVEDAVAIALHDKHVSADLLAQKNRPSRDICGIR